MYHLLNPYENLLPQNTDLRLQKNHTHSITIVNGNVMANAHSEQGGVSARVRRFGAYGFNAVPDFSETAIKSVISQAEENANQFEQFPTGLTQQLPSVEPVQGIWDYREGKVIIEDSRIIQFMLTLDKYIADKYPDLIKRALNYNSMSLEKALLTSFGTKVFQYIPRTLIVIELAVKHQEDFVNLYNVAGGFGLFVDNFDQPEAHFEMIDKLYLQLQEKAKGVYCRGGEFEVILDSELAGILAHEAIGHTTEADLVIMGSVSADFMHQKVASDLITLKDHGQRSSDGKSSTAVHVDDEGVKCRDITIIDRGVLNNYMHDRESAQYYNTLPTGNSRAWSFSDEPIIRMRSTFIEPGTSKLEEMISQVDDGYYFCKPSNGQADSTSEFMFGVIFGYEIKGGKLGSAIRDTTISGVAFDMLKTVSAVSDDMVWTKGGLCGKKQPMIVGMGGPAIRCRINVGGRL